MLCCALMACKKVNVDFSYTPSEPRAGEKVQFTNLTTSGEDWSWSFGDGGSSTIKSPTHTYKKPGTYRVLLKVDKKNSLTESKELTVYDTIPTFVASDTVFSIYEDYTFTANVYNPYNYEMQYFWYSPVPETGFEEPRYVITDTTMTNSTLHLYFTRPGEAKIGLLVILNDDTTRVEKPFDVQDQPTNSVLMRTLEGDYRQRIFGKRAADYEQDATATPLLDAEQDTMQVYNGHTFTLSEIATVFPGIEGFHIANRKIYFRLEGLWVANIDGANCVQIDSADCYAMTLDSKDSRIYWANESGVWSLPFIGSDNNKFVTLPSQLNDLQGVIKIAADNDLK